MTPEEREKFEEQRRQDLEYFKDGQKDLASDVIKAFGLKYEGTTRERAERFIQDIRIAIGVRDEDAVMCRLGLKPWVMPLTAHAASSREVV